VSEPTEAPERARGEPNERADLEAERDFLLRSLDDLEAEHAAGDIDDASYQRLHEDYTARAAASIRALRDGVDARPPRTATTLRRRVLIIGGVAGFAVLAGVALASALGARLPGQTSSGNSQVHAPVRLSTTQQRRQLEAAIARNPSDVTSRLLLAQLLEQGNNLVGALQQYNAISQIQPNNAVAVANQGRILYLTAEAAPTTAEATQLDLLARSKLDQAIELDPQYPDAHFFRAIVLANEYQDYAGAQTDLQHYLVLAPNGQYAGEAQAMLAQVTNALTGPPATNPPSSSRKAKR
jgi:cytochrome c-type biogenesis protein CcmH/NrfG